MNITPQIRNAAQIVSLTHNRTAYIYRRPDNGKIIILICKRNETWLDEAPIELLEAWNGTNIVEFS
jgi:hypothetical protein